MPRREWKNVGQSSCERYLISSLASNSHKLTEEKVEGGKRAKQSKENVFNLDIRLIMKLEEDAMMEWKVHEGFYDVSLSGKEELDGIDGPAQSIESQEMEKWVKRKFRRSNLLPEVWMDRNFSSRLARLCVLQHGKSLQ
jgi:hypothetical protein